MKLLQPRNIGMYGLGVGDFDNWPVRKPIFKKKNLIFLMLYRPNVVFLPV